MKRFVINLSLLAVAFSTGSVFASPMVTVTDDTTRIKLKNRELLVIESSKGDSSVIIIEGTDTTFINPETKDHAEPEKNEFARWGGIDLFVNGFMDKNQNTNLKNSYPHLDLDYARSIGFSFNAGELYIPIAKGNFGITTGLGFQFNRYVFRRNTVLQYNADSLWYFTDTVRTFDKNVLKSAYLQVPLLLQINTSNTNPNRAFHFAAGIVGGYKLGSKLKFRYEMNDDTNKDKVKGSFNLNPFQLNATTRLGYGKFVMFANYNLLTLFERDRGPELYPFTAGVTIAPW